jgi:hypothetical protein
VSGKAIIYQDKPVAWLADDLLEMPLVPRFERLTVVIIAVAEKRLGLI